MLELDVNLLGLRLVVSNPILPKRFFYSLKLAPMGGAR